MYNGVHHPYNAQSPDNGGGYSEWQGYTRSARQKEDDNPGSVGNLLKVVNDKKHTVLAITLFVGIFVAAYSLLAYQPQYSANSTVLIKDRAILDKYVTEGDAPDPSRNITSTTTNPLLNTLGLLKTDDIRDTLWTYFYTKHPEELRRLEIRDNEGWNNYFENGTKFIKAKNVAGTDYLNVKFRWSNPTIAKEGLDQILIAFKNAGLRLNQDEERERSLYIEKQADEVRKRLELVRSQISQFQQRSGTVDIDHDKENYAKSRLDLEAALAEVNSDAASKSSEMSQYQKLLGMNANQAVAASALGGNENISKLYQQLYDLQEQHKSLKTRYTDQNPKIIEINQQLKQVQSNIDSETRRTLGSTASAAQLKKVFSNSIVTDKPRGDAVMSLLQANAESKRLNVKASVLRQYLNNVSSKMDALPAIEKNLADLRDQEDILSDSLKILEQKNLEAKIRETQTISNIFVMEHPTRPTKADFPNQPTLIVLGFLLGAALGVGFVLFRQQMVVAAETSTPRRATANAAIVPKLPRMDMHEAMQYEPPSGESLSKL